MLLRTLALAFSLLAGGCANISQSTVDLSSEVGIRMSEMQSLHVNAITLHFDTQRERIERFLSQTWEPLFLANFLKTSNILDDLQEEGNKPDEPARMMMDFAQAAHEEMNRKRREMLQPLEQMRATALAEINASYAEVLAAQSAITARLQAASRVTQEQDRLVDSLARKEGTAQKIRAGMDCVNGKVTSALDTLQPLEAIKLEEINLENIKSDSKEIKKIQANISLVDNAIGILSTLANTSFLGDCNGK
jgi:hypothetical protein